ncbi:hypothetical protein ABT364_22960 [Massilia sp. SR12]
MESSLNKVWKERPELVRHYYDLIPSHQRLCEEIKYILDKEIQALGIEIAQLTSRAKSLESFCEKVERKTYKYPFDEITDFSGVRVVYLYASERKKLEQLIKSEFEVHEEVDKISNQGVDKFGYGALHYIVSLKVQHAGARYDDLRGLRCEIQIRTILQDAWAVVAHHLSYKQEDDVPPELKRKLNALSGLFEVADDQFEGINLSRIAYQNNVKASITENSELTLESDTNLDNLMAYISWKFPDRRLSPSDAVSGLLQELNEFGYKKLKQLDLAVNRALDAVLECEKHHPPTNEDDSAETDFTGVGLIRSVLEFVDEDYLISRNSPYSIQQVEEFSHLLK